MPSTNFTTNFTTNYWDNVTNVTNKDMDDLILLAVLSYSILYSSSVLTFDIIYGLYQLCRQHRKKWNERTVTGTKDLVACTSTCSVTEDLVLTEILGINMQIMFALLGEQNYEAFFKGYTHIIVLCAIVASGWNVLYYVQLIPSLSLYVVAVQRMLHKTVAFLTAFALFFLLLCVRVLYHRYRGRRFAWFHLRYIWAHVKCWELCGREYYSTNVSNVVRLHYCLPAP